MKILVVEDDPWSQHLVREVLELGGHEVAVANNVGEARGCIAGVDAILLDIHLPGGSGESLLREIRASGATLPVIALTASAMTGDRERFLRTGFSGYLSKPIDVRTFCKTIEEMVR
jgi:CheY-like chemotaxis protein